VPVVTAMQTDVPGAVAALPALLADAGVRYLAVAHNYAGRSVPYLHGGQRLGRPFWWQAPGGRRVLVWYTDSPHGVAYMEGNLVGLAESADVAEELLPEYLAALASQPYPYTPGYAWLGLPEGMEQGLEAVLLDVGDGHVELLSPLGPETVVGRFISKRGEGLHHVAYRVDDIDRTLAELRDAGVVLIDSEARIGIRGSRVAFVHPKSTGSVLTELVEPAGDHG